MEIDDSLFYFPSNINLKKNNDLTYARDFKSFDGKGFEKKFDTRTEKGIRPQILMAGKSIVNSMSISNASNRSSVSSKKTIQK